MTSSTSERERIGVVVIHGVGDAEPGWINDYVLPKLAGKMPPLVFEPYSEVYKLPDRGRIKGGSFFPAHISRGQMGDNRTVALAELYWADLSKVGTGPIYYLLAALRLFFEAPSILAKGFLEQSTGLFHRTLSFFTIAATWLLRWPIAGMNVTAFICAGVVLLLNELKWFNHVPLAVSLMATLAVLFFGGIALARARLHRDIWLTDVSLATAIVAGIAFLAVILLNGVLPVRELARPIDYLALSLPLILRIWVIWSVVIAIAIALLTLLYIKRGLGFRPAGAFPAARPSAALGLALLQGLIWKVAVTLPSVATIKAVEEIQPNLADRAVAAGRPLWHLFAGETAPCVKATVQPFLWLCGTVSPDTARVVKDAIARLNGVFVFNTLNAVYAFAAFVLLILVRQAIARFPRVKVATKAKFMPRLILSQLIVAVLFAGSLANLVIYEQGLYEAKIVTENLPGIRAIWIVPGLVAAAVAVLYLFGVFQAVVANVIHIFRDIVDHQYKPQFDALKMVLPKKGMRTDSPWPRRARIQERMNVLMEEFVRKGGFEQVVFLAHSQGAVILYEYLKSRDDNVDLRDVKRIDVVTFGSPLGHLYQYYFDEYGSQQPTAESLHPQLKSWTNMWRVDDPIGNRVSIIEGDFIRNIVLPPGGHMNYWKEPKVRDTIIEVLSLPMAVAEPAPAPAPIGRAAGAPVTQPVPAGSS
jgi:hypothetical protein